VEVLHQSGERDAEEDNLDADVTKRCSRGCGGTRTCAEATAQTQKKIPTPSAINSTSISISRRIDWNGRVYLACYRVEPKKFKALEG
jgi:hypothetical protein